MQKFRERWVAKEFAKENDEYYGLCVFDGNWYVGLRQELNDIGIPIVDIRQAFPFVGQGEVRV